MSPDGPPLSKPDLRRRILSARAAISPAERESASGRIVEHLRTRLVGASRVAAYVPVGSEPGGAALPDQLRSWGLLVLLPVLLPNNDLDWAEYDGQLTDGPHGLREPTTARLGTQAIRDVDALIVPAVAVDRRGVRLGRGGGSYDRVLDRVGPSVVTVAPLYDGELLSAVPAEPHDRTVAAVVTPGGWQDLVEPHTIATPR